MRAAACRRSAATRADEIDAMLAQLQAATTAAACGGANPIRPTRMGAAAPMPDFRTTDEPPNVASESTLGRSNRPARGRSGAATPDAALPRGSSERGL